MINLLQNLKLIENNSKHIDDVTKLNSKPKSQISSLYHFELRNYMKLKLSRSILMKSDHSTLLLKILPVNLHHLSICHIEAVMI
jgi:hypothetical protein